MKRVRSEFIDRKVIEQIDDENPKFSMFLLALEIAKNCFARKYEFRNLTMKHRFKNHGVLPKSFIRQNFYRSTKLLELTEKAGYTLDKLIDEIAENERFEKVELFERKENKQFLKLI